jgi:hypothetical protein
MLLGKAGPPNELRLTVQMFCITHAGAKITENTRMQIDALVDQAQARCRKQASRIKSHCWMSTTLITDWIQYRLDIQSVKLGGVTGTI